MNTKLKKEKIDIIKYQEFLNQSTFKHLLNCYMDYSNKNYLSSVIWGSIFLESFLNQLLNQLNIIRESREDLWEQTKKLEVYANNNNDNRIEIPDDIIKRCHEIRMIRNRLVHSTGLPKSTLPQDSDSVWNSVFVIVNWYIELSLNKITEKPLEEEDKKRILVFISTIKPHQAQQIYFLEMLKKELIKMGIQPIQLQPSKYDKKDPIGKVRDTIKKCKGFIALGLERTHSYLLRDKEGSDDEKERYHRRYTSSWLHLEAGLAHGLGLDIFVICEKKICNDGIFDRDWNSYTVIELNSLDENSSELKEFLNHIQLWVQS